MLSSGRYKVASVSNLAPGTGLAVNAGGEPIALFNVNGDIYAIANTCTHAEASLSEGELDGYEVTCPLHASRFDVRTGAVRGLPATSPVETFPVEIDDGEIVVIIS